MISDIDGIWWECIIGYAFFQQPHYHECKSFQNKNCDSKNKCSHAYALKRLLRVYV